MKINLLKEDVILTDLSAERYASFRPSIELAIEELSRSVVYGRIGHPADDCSPEEYLSFPPEDERAFEISNIRLSGDLCMGDLKFLDNELGHSACRQWDSGARMSYRIASYNEGVKIITWDLIPTI